MTSRSWPILVAVVAIAGVIAWFALRHHADPEPVPPSVGSAHGSDDLTAGSGAAPRAPLPPSIPTETPRPQLPAGSAATDAMPTATAAFEAQDRDPKWAAKTEAEIKRRFQTIHGGRLESTECRESQCELVVTGTQAELGTTIAEIDDPKGLHGFAQTILLTAPEEKDGKLVLRAYATFAR